MKPFPFSRIIIKDHSMEPFYNPGDHVLTFNWSKPKIDDVIVFKTIKEAPYFIKRIIKISGELIYVSGDNQKASSTIAPISQKQIIGRVILKY